MDIEKKRLSYDLISLITRLYNNKIYYLLILFLISIIFIIYSVNNKNFYKASIEVRYTDKSNILLPDALLNFLNSINIKSYDLYNLYIDNIRTKELFISTFGDDEVKMERLFQGFSVSHVNEGIDNISMVDDKDKNPNLKKDLRNIIINNKIQIINYLDSRVDQAIEFKLFELVQVANRIANERQLLDNRINESNVILDNYHDEHLNEYKDLIEFNLNIAKSIGYTKPAIELLDFNLNEFLLEQEDEKILIDEEFNFDKKYFQNYYLFGTEILEKILSDIEKDQNAQGVKSFLSKNSATERLDFVDENLELSKDRFTIESELSSLKIVKEQLGVLKDVETTEDFYIYYLVDKISERDLGLSLLIIISFILILTFILGTILIIIKSELELKTN